MLCRAKQLIEHFSRNEACRFYCHFYIETLECDWDGVRDPQGPTHIDLSPDRDFQLPEPHADTVRDDPDRAIQTRGYRAAQYIAGHRVIAVAADGYVDSDGNTYRVALAENDLGVERAGRRDFLGRGLGDIDNGSGFRLTDIPLAQRILAIFHLDLLICLTAFENFGMVADHVRLQVVNV